MNQVKLNGIKQEMARDNLLEKTLILGKIEGSRRRGNKDEMVGRHCICNGYNLGQTPGDGEGQRGLACCSSWHPKESDITQPLNNNNNNNLIAFFYF